MRVVHPLFLLSASVLLPFASAKTSANKAAANCPAPIYYSYSAYTGYNVGCYPTTYNTASDLGNTNPSDAANRCAQQCSANSACGGYVAQVNKAADTNLYSGSCFFYTTVPTSPRQCANTDYLLLVGVKDITPSCFASSSKAASTFCSRYLSYGTKTVTATAKASTVTSTTTLPFPTTSTAATSSFTGSLYSTQFTATGPTTIVVTKRAATDRPACIPTSVPASQLSSDCSCFGVSSKVVTTTTTPPVSTAIVTVCPTPSGNVLANPGFNDGLLNGWTVVQAASLQVEGSFTECGPGAVRVRSAGNSYTNVLKQTVTGLLQQNYAGNVYVNVSSLTGCDSCYFTLTVNGGPDNSASTPVKLSNFVKYSMGTWAHNNEAGHSPDAQGTATLTFSFTNTNPQLGDAYVVYFDEASLVPKPFHL